MSPTWITGARHSGSWPDEPVPGSSVVTARPPVCRGAVQGAELADLQSWAAVVEGWAAGSHVWGHYAEQTDSGPAICRTENVSACHVGFARVVAGPLREIAEAQLGTAVLDFKDKINYKHPGGGGFGPHQDLVAYPGATDVLSVLVAMDECSTMSGCLWMDPGVDDVLATDDRGVITAHIASSLSWVPIELSPGDAVCIGGLVPHFSQENRSSAKRRVLVASYAPQADGYTRSAYYDARQRVIEGAPADRRRISTLDDFEGRTLHDNPAASTHRSRSGRAVCSH